MPRPMTFRLIQLFSSTAGSSVMTCFDIHSIRQSARITSARLCVDWERGSTNQSFPPRCHPWWQLAAGLQRSALYSGLWYLLVRWQRSYWTSL